MEDITERSTTRISKAVLQNPTVDGILVALSKITNIRKDYLGYSFFVAIMAWLAFGSGGQLLCNLIGFVYPAFCSIKALDSKNKEDDHQWLIYWVVYALFSVAEFFTDILVGWVPFYWLSKCAFLVWCMCPANGASIIYHSFALPWFRKNQSTIEKVVNEGRRKMSNLAEQAIHTGNSYAMSLPEVPLDICNPGEITSLVRILKKRDVNNSMNLTPEEFRILREFSTTPLGARVIKMLDEDQNGEIELEEFVEGVRQFTAKGDESSKLRFVFKIYDLDNDGYISSTELFQVVKMMTGAGIKDIQQIVDKTILLKDKDEDGKINFEEFCEIANNAEIHKKMTKHA